MGRHQAAPAEPPEPGLLTPESVRQSIAGRGGPEQLGRWAGEHLADRAENGTLRPKTAEEIAATVDRLADQAVDLVRPESHRSEDLYSRTGHRTNQDVFDNGGEAPQTMEAVHHVADILGLDLGGVEIRLIDEPSEIRYMDHMGASAVTRRDGEHLEVALGPASFASAESLAVNLAHEHRHVEQHRSGASVDTASLRGLEEDAYGVEGAALERFRARFEGWDSAGEVPGRGGVRPAEEGIDPGGRTGGGRSGVGGDDASSRGDRSHDQDSGHRSDTTAGRQPRPGELDHRSGQRDAADAGDDPGRSVAASRSGAGDEVRHTASPIGGSDFVPDGRAWHEPDVSVAELHRAAQGALPADFADGRVSYVTSDGPHVRVEMTDGSVRHFLPRVGEGMRDLAETTVRSGTPEDPHIVDVNRRVAGEQLTRVWVHEITETLALQHAAESRPEPHGLVRRAMAAVGRIFGRGDTPQPEAARIDPHVAARINERLHLQRLHDWSWARPDEQIRLQREIAGVDRDLAALGHGVDPPRLEWRSSDWGVPHEIVQDGVIRGAHHAIPAHEPARHEPAPPESSFDRHWTDKPWEREGRRPSLDELIPLTDAEAAHWGGEVKAEVARQIESREFGEGFRVRFDEDRGHPISVDRNSVTLRFKVYGPDGSLAGHTIRGFSRENDGTLYVTHSSIKLYDEAQGRGFSDGWNSFLEDWYHESGVNHIEVHAVDRGAYAWARAGYDWAPNTEHRANGVLKNLRSAVGRIDEHLDQLDRWRRGEVEPDIASLLERYGAVHPDQLPDRMRYERDAGQQILDRAARHPFGSEGYPTPNEISRAGADGRHGRDQVWVGKEALLGSDWKGVKPISDGGVAHPHPRTDAPGGLTRPLELVPHSGPRGPGEPRTPLRDLFPPTEEQAAHWRPVVERALIRELEGRDFAGLEVRVDSVSAEPGHIVAHLSVLRPDHPEPVGRITRQFVVDRTGEMEALHTTLALDRGFQGKGFARAFNDHMEGWYAESGVDRVSLEAASSVGGYAWARDGYGWDPRYGAGEAHGAFRRLQSELGNLWADIERLDQADAAGDSRTVDQIVRRYGFSDFETAWDRMTEQAREADTLLEKYHASGLGRPTFPSPNDISQAGRAGEAGHTASWIGKRAMMGSSWHGSRVPEPRPEAPLRAEPEPHHHDAPQHDHELHDQDLHDAHRWPARTNYDVLVNGSDVPLHEAAVAHVAELLGIDLSGVRVHLITDSAEALHYDAWGVSAVTPPEKGGREIRLGPAAFADAETLAATVAHEYTHVVQLREGRELGTHTMRALEDEAFASEGPALDRFRQGFEGWERVREGAVLDRGGPRPEEPGRPAGFGEGSRGSDLHRGDAAGRGDWSYGESAGSGVRDAGGPFAGTDHVGGGAHESHPDSRRPDPRDLNRPIGGRRSDGPPFGYDRYYRDPRWTSEAVAFEMRLGVHYFNDPHTLNTAREAVSHLRDVLTRLATSGVDDPVARAAIAREVETAFFRGDEKSFNSAGQVGLGVPLDAVLREGNLRELMTAFYNAAYFNRDSPHTLAATLLDVIDRGRWDEAARAGIDVAELYDMRDQLDHSLNRAIFGRIEEIRPPSESPRFVRDVFATGNVIMRSPRGFRNMLEVVASQLGRRARDEVEQLALATTVGHYEQLGAPLGKFERAFVESILGGSLEPGTKLPWREGVVSHDTGGSIWARGVGRDGYPVLDGVSATTTRMLTGVKMIGIHGPEATHFLHALMGWMLPARDHSIFELLRGGSMAGVEPLAVHPRSARPTAIDLYRNLPGVDPHTLRTEVAEGGLFPHEARYLDHALDPNGFAETQHRVQEIADRLRPQLESGRVTDADLAHWLERNGIDPHDPVAVRDFAEHLTRPHMISMAVYSLYSHQLINTVITAHMMTREVSESAVRLVHDRAIANLVDPYLHKLAEGKTPSQLPFGLRSVLHEGDGLLDSTSPLRPSAQRWVEAIQARHAAREEAQRFLGAGDDVSARRAKVEADRAGSDAAAARRQIAGELGEVAPKLFDEVRWHADMVYDALMQLPTVGTPQEPVVAYRGAAANLASTVTYGNRILPGGKAVSVLSLSRDLEVAVGFMTRNSASDDKVLAVYRLIGVNARDISVFSAFPRQQEIVLPPRARTIRVSDPILEQQVRDQLPPEWRDHCRIIVLEERG